MLRLSVPGAELGHHERWSDPYSDVDSLLGNRRAGLATGVSAWRWRGKSFICLCVTVLGGGQN